MGNSLLDFVMALVRDPAMAARYAADPAGVLADAHLAGVTIADVDNLIPVVKDSLAASTPGFGPVADSPNVWTSGAAAAAFDAFDIHIPLPDRLHQPAITPQPAEPTPGGPAPEVVVEAAPLPVADDPPAHQPVDPVPAAWPDADVWQHPQSWQHPGDPTFDLF